MRVAKERRERSEEKEKAVIENTPTRGDCESPREVLEYSPGRRRKARIEGRCVTPGETLRIVNREEWMIVALVS